MRAYSSGLATRLMGLFQVSVVRWAVVGHGGPGGQRPELVDDAAAEIEHVTAVVEARQTSLLGKLSP